MKNLSGAEDFLVEDFSFIPCTPVNMVASYLKFKLYAETCGKDSWVWNL